MHPSLRPGSFFGTDLARREVGGFLFAESAFAAGARIPVHTHENPFFYLVVDGLCEETAQSGTRLSGPATLVFHPAGAPHSDHWPQAGRCLHIEISHQRLRQLDEYCRVLDTPAEFRDGPAVSLAARVYRELRGERPLAGLLLEGLGLELLAEASMAETPPPAGAAPRWLGSVRELLHAQFREPLALEEVAAAAGVHPAHLARVFRRHHHCSVGEYLRRLRIEWACEQLSRSEMALAEIAVDAGFVDQAHFCRTFKRCIGTTPGAYRRSGGTAGSIHRLPSPS
jgi:AraC family transcriptional regulator